MLCFHQLLRVGYLEAGSALASETALQKAGTTLSPEALPHLLHMFSAGELSFIARDSPESSVHAGTDHVSVQGSDDAVRSTHDRTLSSSEASHEGLDASPSSQTLPASPIDGCTAVDISKLMADGKTTRHSTGVLTAKSVLPKARSPMTQSPPHRVQGELSKKVSFNKQSPNSDAPKLQSQQYVPLKRKFYSQPMPAVANHSAATNGADYGRSASVQRCTSQTLEGGKSERDVIFRTKSNRFDKSYGRSNSKQQQDERDSSTVQSKKGDENRPVQKQKQKQRGEAGASSWPSRAATKSSSSRIRCLMGLASSVLMEGKAHVTSYSCGPASWSAHDGCREQCLQHMSKSLLAA